MGKLRRYNGDVETVQRITDELGQDFCKLLVTSGANW